MRGKIAQRAAGSIGVARRMAYNSCDSPRRR
jgi:hypothetical protein